MNKFYCGKKEWNKIIDYSRAAYDTMQSEIGGMALMIKDDEGDWHLKQPVILKQEVTSGNTHLDKVALAEYYGQTATKMLKKKNVTYKYLWWHSHHTMAAFWSGTDQDTINEAEEMSDLSFSLVVNLKEEYKFRVAIWKPIKVQQDVELEIETKERSVSKPILAEVEALCSERSIMTTYAKNGLQRNLWGGYSKTKINDPDKIVTTVDDFDKALERVSKMIDKACDGTLKYEAFNKELTKIGNHLAESGEAVFVRTLTKEEFDGGKLLGITAYDLIQDEDMMQWNWSYHV